MTYRNYFENRIKDIRYELRSLAKRPGLSVVAILTLALGIGANTAIFSLVNGILLEPLPYREPRRLVRLTEEYPLGGFQILRNGCQAADLATYWPGEEFNLSLTQFAATPARLNGAAVSANLFSLLGVQPEIGRTFEDGDDTAGRTQLVILSHNLWQNEFAMDSHILGRNINLEDKTFQVVGVMPSNFKFPSPSTDIWVPLELDPRNSGDYWGPQLPIIGRLRGPRSTEQAREEVRSLLPQIVSSSPYPLPANWNSNASIISLQEDLVGNVRPKLLVLLGAVGLVLVIVCTNLANLLLAQAAARQKEVAIRSALGASRSRIINQLLTESLILAVCGAAVGLLLAWKALVALKVLFPANTARLAEVSLDNRVLVFTGALAILTGFVFGLAPALKACGIDPIKVLNAGGRTSGRGGSGLKQGLVIAEIMLAVVVVIGAGLLTKSLWLLAHVSKGFTPDNVLAVQVTPDKDFSKDRQRCINFYDELLRRLTSLPGVQGVAAINALPLSPDIPVLPTSVQDFNPGEADPTVPLLWAGAITPEYTALMQIPILEGRGFSESDRADTAGVVLVGASTAEHFWPGQNAIGKHLKPVWDTQWRTVVGVVKDVTQYGLAKHRPSWIAGEIYMPYSQAVLGHKQFPSSMSVIVRTTTDKLPLSADMREIVDILNPGVPIAEPHWMTDIVSQSLEDSRSTTWLLGAFALLALILGALGIYGLISYSVAERKHEVGVRMALGAKQFDVLKLIVGQGLTLTIVGILLGVLAASGLTRLLASLLYGVKPIDWSIFLLVSLTLAIVAVVASYIPAQRAVKVDPTVALRVE